MTTGPLRLVGHSDCELCIDLHAHLLADPVIAAHGVEWLELPEHPDLVALYLFRVPVLLLGEREIWQGPADADTCPHVAAALRA
ncbi:MAG: glutaredoxin family protein [Gammaproteobacteria bacterium]|nr:glutaredoxin family protein [Gammaproteobacteria bacterium]